MVGVTRLHWVHELADEGLDDWQIVAKFTLSIYTSIAR